MLKTICSICSKTSIFQRIAMSLGSLDKGVDDLYLGGQDQNPYQTFICECHMSFVTRRPT